MYDCAAPNAGAIAKHLGSMRHKSWVNRPKSQSLLEFFKRDTQSKGIIASHLFVLIHFSEPEKLLDMSDDLMIVENPPVEENESEIFPLGMLAVFVSRVFIIRGAF